MNPTIRAKPQVNNDWFDKTINANNLSDQTSDRSDWLCVRNITDHDFKTLQCLTLEVRKP